MKKKFTYGDRVRRVTGGPVKTIRNIDMMAYHFDDGTFMLREDEDCYQLMEPSTGFFLVARSLDGAPIDEYNAHGYEQRSDFRNALLRMTDRYGGRVGECIGERYGFLRLRFHDTPGVRLDEAWLPYYLLQPSPLEKQQDHSLPPSKKEAENELDEIFGFD